ncbi:hypothetical protein MKZ20_19170 [Psychrobacillus sp. FSL K6-2684]|nr:hypothetical protein [Psychrobacillus sp. AK 1817]
MSQIWSKRVSNAWIVVNYRDIVVKHGGIVVKTVGIVVNGVKTNE